MRRPGAPALRRFHRGSRLLRTPSPYGRQEDEHPSPLLEQDLSSLWRTPPLAAAAPSLQNSPDIGERARQPRVFRAWKESSRTSRENPAGITPMPAPFSAMRARQKGHMQGSSLTERLCRSQTGSALPHPDLQAPGLHVRNLAQSILSACSVCRPISPDSMASGKPVLGMVQISCLRLLPRFIEAKDMLHIYTDRHCQPMLRFDICACPSPVMISCSE